MIDKIHSLLAGKRARQLRDVRVVGFIVFGFIVLLVSYSGVGVIQTNFELQKKVAKLQQENAVAELRNENLRLRNQYYATDEYKELVARKQYGKALPGETLILVPEEVALEHSAPKQENAVPKQMPAGKPTYQRNLESWRDFILNRQVLVR
ncbi:hypothetical protein CR970_00335 [Candidatus Saccharibacteria bacterium]|nr:MAG: hypothetical protein CR970_00335 [Candidatus Saccharibacteria bacterium]